MKIPIANVYYLLLYAWKHVQKKDLTRADSLPQTELCDLFGDVIASEAGRLLSRGLARDYLAQSVVVAGIRGRMDVGSTVKRQLLSQARTVCVVDDFLHDVVRNRIIKATVRRLIGVERLDEKIRERLRRVYAKLDGVADIAIEPAHFRLLQAHRHARSYDFILRLCRLVFDHTMVDQKSGATNFHDFRDDDARMWQLFEHFIREFFRVEQHQFSVGSRQIGWHDAHASDPDLAFLPTMQADVVLESPVRCLIIDAKFYRDALVGQFEQKRVNSEHLYQLLTYVDNRTAAFPEVPHDGMLLYPVVTEPFAFTFALNSRRIAVRSIDLAQPWAGIHRDMLALLA